MQLLTPELRQTLLSNAGTPDRDLPPAAKFFNPAGAGTWLVVDADPEDNDILPRVLAARPDTLRALEGLGEAGVAAIKTAEALGIRMARAELPERINPKLDAYARVVDYCRALAGHRDVEEFNVLYLDTKNRLLRDERHSSGTVNHTPVYPRQVCVRALEVGAAALVVVHQHPSGDPTPSRPDVQMTNRLRDSLKTIDVDLHDHIIVTPRSAFSFREKGLL